MPPKKKKGEDGKGKKKGKKNAKKVIVGPPPTEPLDEESKEYFLVQIHDLENRIARYQKRCDELEVRNGEFQNKFEKLSEDKKDIVLFIKKKLDEKTDEIAEVNEQLMGLQQVKDTEKESFEQQLQQLRTEYQETKDQLTSENMMLGGKLASLEEFKVQREELIAKMNNLEQELMEQERLHKEDVYNLERKQVIDKDRLKKEMIQRVNQVAAEFRKISNRQMADTTKRTIRENVTINVQLTKMSDKTMELIEDNDGLKERERRQRQMIEILEANEKVLTTKNLANQKLIRQLTEKCRAQEQQLLEFESRKEQYRLLEAELDLLRQQLDNTRMETMMLSQENEDLERQLKDGRSGLEDRLKLRLRLEGVIIDAVQALQSVIHDSVAEDCSDSPADIGVKRSAAIENLLRLLNSSLELEKRRAASEHGPDEHRAGSADQLGRYQLGDLGLIPRPEQHIPTNLDKVRQIETTRLGALKRVVNKSVATQTVSTAKVMFLADQLISKFPASREPLKASSRNSAPSSNRTLPPVIPAPSKLISAKMY